MKKDKGPKFGFDGTCFINDRDGNIGEVYKDGESWLVRLTHTVLSGKRKEALEKRMAEWYYFTQISSPALKGTPSKGGHLKE